MSFDIIYQSPAQMLLSERTLLYALVYGLRPAVALEIGTAQGGSAMIICAAMDASGCGRLVCVDQAIKIVPDNLTRVAHRISLLEGLSFETIPRAYELVKTQFDFAFVDGDHSYEGVLKDIEAVSQFLREGSYVLFHDAHYFEVKEAIDATLKRYPFVDCGMLSLEATLTNDIHMGKPVVWGGLRLLRFLPSLQGFNGRREETAQTQTELDVLTARVRERVGNLSGWHGALIRKTLRLSYRSMLGLGRLFF